MRRYRTLSKGILFFFTLALEMLFNYATYANEAETRRAALCVYEMGERRRKAVKQYVLRMTEETKAAQLFLVNINGSSSFYPVENILPGGYIFFHYNIADSKQGVKDFTSSISKWCKRHGALPPYLAVDQEGGDVQRLRGVAAPLPSESTVAANMTEGEAAILYGKMADEMRGMGFHLNLAPVAEALNERNSEVLGTRTFGGVEEVMRYGGVCVLAYEKHGIAAAIKHFPGNTATDPHTGKSEAVITEEEMVREVSPFIHLVALGAEGVVMSHARFNEYPPACLSEHWVNVLLDTGFRGLIISDDIFMPALQDGYTHEEAAVKAIEAGVDVIMLSEKRCENLVKAVAAKAKEDDDFAQLVEKACNKVVLFKMRHNILSIEDIQ